MARYSKGLAIRGSDKFQQKLKELRKKHPKRFGRGIIRAGLLVKRESQKIVPVDTGALKASSYIRHSGEGANVVVRIGYSQSYAIFVHEMVNLQHKPGKSAKYIERILKEKQREMIAIVNREFDVHG